MRQTIVQLNISLAFCQGCTANLIVPSPSQLVSGLWSKHNRLVKAVANAFERNISSTNLWPITSVKIWDRSIWNASLSSLIWCTSQFLLSLTIAAIALYVTKWFKSILWRPFSGWPAFPVHNGCQVLAEVFPPAVSLPIPPTRSAMPPTWRAVWWTANSPSCELLEPFAAYWWFQKVWTLCIQKDQQRSLRSRFLQAWPNRKGAAALIAMQMCSLTT